MISDSIFGYHVVRQQLLVPCFFSRSRWFSSSLFVRIPFLCHLSYFWLFLYFCFFGIIAYQNSCHDVLRLCYHMSTKKKHMKVEHERKCTKWKYEIAVSVALGRHNTRWEESWCLHQIQKEIELKMAAIKLGLCLTKWQGACSPRKLPWKGVLHFVCMYVCMHACMHACMDGWMDVCTYVCMCIYIYTVYYFIYIYISPLDFPL